MISKVITVKRSITSRHPRSTSSNASAGPLQSSTIAPSTQPSSVVSFASGVSDVAQTFVLPVLQPVVGMIPVVGSSLGAAIDGINAILQIVDRRTQNKAELSRLTQHLNRLACIVYNSPPARTQREQSQMKGLISMLEKCTARLTKLQKHCLPSASTSQEIAGCFNDIRDGLEAYKFWRDMETPSTTIQHAQMHSPHTAMLEYVTLMDATGRKHPISYDHCRNFQQLSDMLQVVLHNCTPEKARVQRDYIKQGQYDFCIDEGWRVTQLSEEGEGWSSIEPGTTIVMRVVLLQRHHRSSLSELLQCPFCGVENIVESRSSASIDCGGCQLRFQAAHSNRKGAKSRYAAEPDLIRNVLVQLIDRRRIFIRSFDRFRDRIEISFFRDFIRIDFFRRSFIRIDFDFIRSFIDPPFIDFDDPPFDSSIN